MPEPDLSSLARLAQNPHAELRPLLLRVQAQGFAAAPSRDAGSVSSFESIALGLIPLVPDDVLSEIAALLRPLPDVPATVLAALAARLQRKDSALEPAGHAEAGRPRLDRAAIARLLAQWDDAVDLVLARNAGIVLDGRLLATLIDRACPRPQLARAMLARAEPTVYDRAALFLHAERRCATGSGRISRRRSARPGRGRRSSRPRSGRRSSGPPTGATSRGFSPRSRPRSTSTLRRASTSLIRPPSSCSAWRCGRSTSSLRTASRSF